MALRQMNIEGNMNVAAGCKWVARILAAILFLFWGAFFVEHLGEWFLQSEQGFPPVSVWIGQALHFVILLGLGMMLNWDRLGSLVTIVGTVAFFSAIGYRGFPFIALLNLLPIGLFGVYWYLGPKAANVAQ